MRWALVVSALCVAVLMTSCGKDTITGPSSDPPVDRPISFDPGTVVVYVYWDGSGLPDKRVELVELGLKATTNAAGIATFSVPPGDYTVRVYEINHGGPGMLSIDTKVSVTEGEQVRVEVFDCLDCV